MALKIGINGFGRIGKLVHRVLAERQMEVYKINDPFTTLEYIKYSMVYDSTHGRSGFRVELKEGGILVNSKFTKFSAEKDPSKIEWDDCDIVIEASGAFTTLEKCEGHLNTAKRVIITAPSSDAPMFVYGVNHLNYNNEKIFSNASCTTNCLAPLAKVINDNFLITEGLMTTVHAITNNQSAVDASKKSFRLGRSFENIIPSTTGAAKAVAKVLPELAGKLNGMSFRVPLTNVSVVDFVFKTDKKTSLKEIYECIKSAAKTDMKGVLCYTDQEVVSSDYNGCSLSSVFDYTASMELNDQFFKVIAWYDNEYGYSCRVVDMVQYTCKQ